jgi:DNA-binding winged helix-turn-helix (wHTH) protein
VRVLFSAFDFDGSGRILLRHGRAIPLSVKAFDLLAILLDRRPEAVSKTDLLAHLWPGTFVSEASLYNLVAEVRAALDDAPREARFIRTVPRYGYAFHGDARSPSIAETGRASKSPTGPRLVSKSHDWILSEGSNLVGRDPDCAVRLDSPSVSRHHARISVAGRETTVEDLRSKNGTYVNDRPVTAPVVLDDGARIRFGSMRMTYRILSGLPTTVTRRA